MLQICIAKSEIKKKKPMFLQSKIWGFGSNEMTYNNNW